MNETIVERKRRERKEKLEKQRKAQQRQIIVFVGTLCIIVIALIYFLNSDFFKVKEVYVGKVEHISNTDIGKAKSLGEKKNIFFFPSAEIRTIFQDNPWVKNVEIRKDWPDRVIIKINERKPFGYITDGIKYYAVSDDGFVLEISDTPENLVQFADLPLKKPEVGSQIKSEEFSQAIKIFKSLPESFKKGVRVISARSPERIIIYMNGIEILYGMAEHLEEKNAVLKQIIQREGTAVISIDIRVPTNPVVK